ncbi:MAG: DNA recombination protein RmuC [Candidatus Dormibacteraeota bacterium]|nr:DNA recombination protein RmuC [Candidatus Dormibacteraeota bacterium]
MSFPELLFALLLVCLLVVVAIVGYMVATINRRAEAQGAELAQVRAALALGGRAQDSAARELRDRLAQTAAQLENVRAAVSSRQQVEDDARQSLRRLEAVIAGSSTRGAAGENILEEALRHLPPEMLHRNLWVNGKVCEFGLRLPDGRLLALDSKWAAGAALAEIVLPDLELGRRERLAATIEKEVEKRAREVAQYIDPAITAPFALAAVPDGAFALCRGAFAEAHRRNVIIVGYSMALPYVLTLFQMHLQFARGVDTENLQACLLDVERQLDVLEGSLENRLQRAVTMLGNSYQESRQAVARIRASVRAIQASERIGDQSPAGVLTGGSGGAEAARDIPPRVGVDADVALGAGAGR